MGGGPGRARNLDHKSLNRDTIRDTALSREEYDSLRAWCADASGDACGDDHSAYDRELRARIAAMPPALRDLGRWFADHMGEAGVVRVRGLPLPRSLPPTPQVPSYQVRAAAGTEPMLLGIGALVGEVIAFKDWRGGARVHNVYPLLEDADTQKASNVVRLAMHTEAAFHAQVPDALALLCLRDGASQPPPTAFCDLRLVRDGLDPGDRMALEEPAFCFSGRHRDGSTFFSDPRPIVSVDRGHLRFQYVDSLLGCSPRHQEVLGRVREGIERHTVELTLRAGDLVLIDNLHMLHGRMPFQQRYDGTDRWLQRCLLSVGS